MALRCAPRRAQASPAVLSAASGASHEVPLRLCDCYASATSQTRCVQRAGWADTR